MPEMADQVETYAPSFIGKFTTGLVNDVMDDPEATPTQKTKIVSYEGLDEDDLWLVYHPAEGETAAYFSVRENNAELNNGDPFTQIAPNEKMPYHGLYAVWRAQNFYVFHSATGKLEAYSYPDVTRDGGTFNLLDHVTGKGETDDYLYGGYYTTYGGLNTATLDGKTVTIADVIAREYDNNITTHSLDATTMQWNKSFVSGKDDCAVIDLGDPAVKSLTGYQKYTGAVWNSNNLPFWAKAKAYNTANATQDNPVYAGTELVPTAGTVYYLKEVPVSYLPARMIAVHETGNNDGADVTSGTISALYLLTAVDDVNYASYGFLKAATEAGLNGAPQKSTISKRFRVYYKDADGNTHLKATYYAHDLNNGIAENDGYVISYQVPVENGKGAYILPTWVTLDGVAVSQNEVYYNVSADGNTVTWNPPANQNP